MEKKDTNNNLDMNNYLLNIQLKNYNVNTIKSNIEKIYQKLINLDITKDIHKYLSLSTIYGSFLGDSMGSCCEFSCPSKNNHNNIFKNNNLLFKIGEVTDDSEMAISAAFAYIDSLFETNIKTQNLIYYYFCIWRYSGPKDIGNATSKALNRKWEKNDSIENLKFDLNLVKACNKNSLSNGFLMRISTFIVYYYYKNLDKIYKIINNYIRITKDNFCLTKEIFELYKDILLESTQNIEITHPNPENSISGAIFSLMVLVGMVTRNAEYVYTLFKKISNSKDFTNIHKNTLYETSIHDTQIKFLNIIKDIEKNQPISVIKHSGYYLHSFRLSVFFLFRLKDIDMSKSKDIYYKIMCNICDLGGDTDTNCAIVGTMIGPLIGYKNFNNNYFDKFIRFIPEKRCQFNSAFMYIYVDLLERVLLKKDLILKEKINNEKNDKNNIYNQKNKINEKNSALDNNKDKKERKLSENSNEKGKNEIKNEKIDKNKRTFNYISLQLIKKFLIKEINI